MKYQSSSYKVGMGLHPSHFTYLEQRPATEVAWFEASSELYMGSRGSSFEMLQLVRQDYPVALHGTGMNIGNPDGIRIEYLKKLRDLIEQVEPFIISDHICWTGTSNHNMHDLLPLPMNEETLHVVANNVDFVQNELKSPLALENIATYVSYRDSDMSESEFLTDLSKMTGCGLVLDLGAAYTNSENHGFNIVKYLNNLPIDKVVQLHLSGPSEENDILFDRKSNDIPLAVWEMLKHLAPRIRHLPVGIERNANIPAFSDLEMEIIKASFILENSHDTEQRTEFV